MALRKKRYTSFDELIAYNEARCRQVRKTVSKKPSGTELKRLVPLFQALSCETRAVIVEHILEKPSTADGLATELDLRPNQLSRYLAELEAVGLVTATRQDRTLTYELAENFSQFVREIKRTTTVLPPGFPHN